MYAVDALRSHTGGNVGDMEDSSQRLNVGDARQGRCDRYAAFRHSRAVACSANKASTRHRTRSPLVRVPRLWYNDLMLVVDIALERFLPAAYRLSRANWAAASACLAAVCG